VGISDLIADEDTKKLIDTKIQEKKKQVEQVILQVHLDLFDNNTGKTNQQEFEDQIFGILNQATSDAGSTGQQSLSAENRLLAMVRSGSKGEPLNVAQMMACLGQTAIEGKRVPYGFTDRTLPHYKKYDDSSEARGFIESSFIRGLTPQQFFFHAMSGREGLIDTAVKSVTADTEIIIQEDGMTKWTTIGSWIDAHLAAADPADVEHHEQANMELLNLTNDVFIPTCDEKGTMTWGKMTAVTRHDPGERIYEVTTLGGRHVTVAESKSLIVWDDVSNGFLAKPTPDVKEGDYLPTTVRLSDPPITVTHIDMKRYVTKLKSSSYSLPDQMELTEENGIFFGLYLAEGNSHIKSGYVNIANNDQTIRTFAMNWFTDLGIKVSERFRTVVNPTRTGTTTGVSNGVRGFSRPLGRFLESFLGAGSANKFVPNEAFGAPTPFLRGLLNGYFSGDGTVDVKKGSVTVNSASKKLIEGISFLCSRFGIFGKMSRVQLKSNNVMTPTERILPTYRFSICAKWATLFATEIPLISHEKQERVNQIHHAHEHRNFPSVEDVAKDAIVSIRVLSTEAHPKLYDVTVPSTLNFSIANGLGLADTADTGYIQRQLIKSMEDLTVQHDGTVRDTNNNIIQYHYGEDGVNPTKIETQSLPIGKLSEQEIRSQFGMEQVDWTLVLQEEIVRENEDEMITEYVNQILQDQRMMVEGVFQKKSLDSGSVFAPVNLARWILNIKVRFALKSTEKTDLTPAMVLQGIQKIIERTHAYHKIWAALLRFHLAPHKLIVKERFTKVAFETLMEIIVVNHMKAWIQPGEQVGIVAAQSIGEPATQMSSVKESLIVLQSDNGLKYYGSIGEICDSILEKNKEKLIHHGKNSVILPLEENYYIVGVSEDEKTSWKRISEISRHPANGGLIEVITRTGRKTTATLTHSFLKRSPTGIVPVLGSELEIGMRIPIAKVIPEVPQPIMSFTQGKTTFTMNREFGWICGMYLADGSFNGNNVRITKISPIVEQKLVAFGEKHGMTHTVHHYQGAFGPGKDTNLLSKDLKDFLMETFSTGSYEKKIGATVFHANKEFIAGVIGGFFDGDGNVSVERQLIRASSRSETLIQQITALLGYVGMFGCMSSETSARIKDKVQHTLVIPRKFAAVYKEQVGFQLPEKAEALDKIIEYNAREDVRSEQEMIDKIPEVGPIIAEMGKLLKMPGQSRTYGRWAKKESIGRQTLTKYVAEFEAKCQEWDASAEKTETRAKVEENMVLLRSALAADVLWDEIVELNEYVDPKEFVYDFTVPGNDSFMVDCNVLVHNTLNSVDWDTQIMIAKNGKIQTPMIGEWIDQYYADCLQHNKDIIQYHPNNQIYIPLEDGHDWKAISCDENGNMKWTTLEAITRHPVVNDDGTNTILKVTLESGREVKATKGKSFLTQVDGKIVPTNGSDLKVGDSLPIANQLSVKQVGYVTEVNVRTILPANEYLYGTEVEKALYVMNTSTTRHWFQHNQGTHFTVPYQRSDSFREAFGKGHNSNDIRPGMVYNKHMKQGVSQIPETIPLDNAFGFFCGAYLAEGMSNDTQIVITNNDAVYLETVKTLMTSWNVGTHTVSAEKMIENTGIHGTSTSLIIHSTILAKLMKSWFGRVSYEKHMPTWALQAPDAFLHGLIDGYISGDGTVDKRQGTIHATSVSRDLLEDIQCILARYGVYSKMTTTMPERGRFQSVARNYTITLPAKYSTQFAKHFTLSAVHKQERLDEHHSHRTVGDVRSKWDTTNDVVWDKIKSIEEVQPMGEGWVYDVTVAETKNFMTKSLILQRDTFHQAGVASKSAVTRGVPRLRELLKVTQNPKASSLTIYLKPEYRNNKEKAREVVQDLELTVLRTITNKVAIYWDEKDDTTVVEEDKDLMRFHALFEEAERAEQAATDPLSKWVLRLELNREEMFNRNLSMEEVVSVIKMTFSFEIDIVYSDYNSDKLVMRIRLPNKDKKDKDTASQQDDFTNLKKFQNKLLNSIVIRGLPGIKAVTFRKDSQYVENINGKYEPVEQYVLDTDGSNFIKVMNHPAVDGTKLYSTNVWDVYEVLGIEATRAILFHEINGLFESVGVNFRHLCLLCDVMTRFGRLMSIDRYGINKNDIGTLAKASFEETEKILLKAALFGEVDPVMGVSANIMMGQPIRGGTAFSQILMDDQVLAQLLKDVDVDEHALEEEKVGDVSQWEETTALTDPCGAAPFQMNMVMPNAVPIMEEPDVEINIM